MPLLAVLSLLTPHACTSSTEVSHPSHAELVALAEGARELPGVTAERRAEVVQSRQAWRADLVNAPIGASARVTDDAAGYGGHGEAEGSYDPSGARYGLEHAQPAPMPPHEPPPEVGLPAEEPPRRSGQYEGVAPAGQRHAGAGADDARSGAAKPFRLLARFASADEEYYVTTEATPLGPGEFLAPAQALYDHDPNRDGDASDAAWATDVWVWPGGADPASKPSGPAVRTALSVSTHPSWVSDRSVEFDVGTVTVGPPAGRR